METSPNHQTGPLNPEQSTFWPEELLASLSPSEAKERDSTTPVDNSCSPFLNWLNAYAPDGSCGKTFQASCRRVNLKDLTSDASFKGWSNAGMASPGECWTLSTLERPNVAVESSLSDVLETGELHPRFSLSAKACQGILRRAAKRGKKLPPVLEAALISRASTLISKPSENTETTDQRRP